jgi:hypothetical protein
MTIEDHLAVNPDRRSDNRIRVVRAGAVGAERLRLGWLARRSIAE